MATAFTVLVGASACAGSGQDGAKFPGSLESAETFSLDSLQACESFAIVRSQNEMATNFAQFWLGGAHRQDQAQSGQSFLAV